MKLRTVCIGAILIAVALTGCMQGDPEPEDETPVVQGPAPTLQIAWSPEQPTAGDEVAFTASAPASAAWEQYLWRFGDGTSSSEAAPSHAYLGGGLFTVTLDALTDDGRLASTQRILAIEGSPEGGSGAPFVPPPTITADVEELGVAFSYTWSGEASGVAWDFGDGATSRDDSPTHVYRDAGTYTVQFTIDANGTLHRASSAVTVLASGVRFAVHDLGVVGAEPSIGITSSGCAFYAAMHRVMRSCDDGKTWDEVQDLFSQPGTSDPWLWVDPVTDRIFNVQMVSLACTWVAWSDDDGESWLGNPWDCGPLPVNDHIKLGTGPWVQEGLNAYAELGANSPLYDTAVYFCYNKLAGVFCYTSFDGGASFPVGGLVIGLAGSGGLHGAITTAPDGTVYVPPRLSTPTVLVSHDNGMTWSTRSMGDDAGTPSPRKNSEVATDTGSNAYHVWTAADYGISMARSTDSGNTWDSDSLQVSPPEIISTAFPHADAGSPGRLAVAYLGSDDAHMLGEPDIDGDPWDGHPHTAPAGVTYDLYVTFSLDALAPQPSFFTVKVTDDPVQAGSICISSGDCRDIGGSNRNLLDFNDLHIDKDGRVHIAFADGCIGECAKKTAPQPEDSRDRRAKAAILDQGPSLFVSVGDLD